MAINKVVMNTENGAETLIDLTSDTVTPETLADGVTAHNAAGVQITGTMKSSEPVDLTDEITEQDTLISQIESAVAEKGVEVETLLEKRLKGTLTTINSDITSVGNYACYGLASLRTVNLPNVTTMGTQAFRGCTKMTTFNAPKLTSISSTYGFYTNSDLSEINLPSLTSINTQCFGICSKLAKADFGVVSSIAASAFDRCSVLVVLILRKTDGVATLANTNAFSSTPIASGTGYIYVPSALVDSYKSAENWSTYANQIRAIEDYPDVCGYGG